MNIKKSKKIYKNDGYYFPLFNLDGLRSSMTPYFDGDLKLDHHQYALTPVTEVDLFHHAHGRNVVFKVNGLTYFLNGQTSLQENDELIYETDLLSQTVIRKNNDFTIETTSYVPRHAAVEIHQIKVKNTSTNTLTFDIHTAVPLYGRSADNLRDHRHVTSLLNHIEVVKGGIFLKPNLSFDERGHQLNDTIYSLFVESDTLQIDHYMPVLDTYIHGGSLTMPKGVDQGVSEGAIIDGYEAFGGIAFKPYDLKPLEEITFYLTIGIHKDKNQALIDHKAYASPVAFEEEKQQVSAFFYKYIDTLRFSIKTDDMSKQLSWVMLQPMLRRFFGNSYMPHHDYGRGGRGWRDLWQDLLALIMTNDESVLDMLYNNFAGVRLDGSNATIIGDKVGEFKADRNQITRVWSDHGAWPLLTVKMYLDETGDLDFLLKKQTYFADQYTHYTKQTRKPRKINQELMPDQKPYDGSVLEHLLIQNLVGYHNVGAHGFTRLEDADWNDGLDMAHGQGETIAFTHMYVRNLLILAELIEALDIDHIELIKPLVNLLEDTPQLTDYFHAVANFDGATVSVDKNLVIKKLNGLAKLKMDHLHQHAFLDTHYASYYNNEGDLLDQPNTFNLTGQTMALLSQTATEEQAHLMADTMRKHLFSPMQGGYLLNTDHKKILTNMGRAFGFAYGHKENGAMFSHMAIMYTYGLYQYDLVAQGHESFMALLERAQDDASKVWVGIPEYFNDQGVGKYSYLTGSASWLLKLLRSEVFGLQFQLGILTLKPKLMSSDFINHKASIKTYVFNQCITITYHNPKSLNFGDYKITSITMNHQSIENHITRVDGDIEVYLDESL
ncbi:MAG: GH36-type glycosyl hydrolase domain-containing protein [Acholeplasmataceae bacterium]